MSDNVGQFQMPWDILRFAGTRYGRKATNMKTNSCGFKSCLKNILIAMAAWEIGRGKSGFGVKVGGMGVIVEELPPALVKAAAKSGIELVIETLSPCFGHYRRDQLTKLSCNVHARIDGIAYLFEVYERIFPQTVVIADEPRVVNFRMLYFWNETWLGGTSASRIYFDDPTMAARTYFAVSQAMADYIRQHDFDSVHLHDYHVGGIPFFLGEDWLEKKHIDITIHNASYQGVVAVGADSNGFLRGLGIRGDRNRIFRDYFEFYNHANLMKAALLKVRESGGQITTVSGDWDATWGYAAELRDDEQTLKAKAAAQKGAIPGAVFTTNGNLDIFEAIPVRGITNGLDVSNRPENQPMFKSSELRKIQAGMSKPIFSDPRVQDSMLAQDHNFDLARLGVKAELTRLLHLEAFNSEPASDTIIFSVVGRLVSQKNLGLVADVIPSVLASVPSAKFIILASAPEGDPDGKADEAAFRRVAEEFPDQVYLNNSFNEPLSKLILAGSHFTLIPSRFEPCGLVDFESSLCGTVAIARNCGGLAKIRNCGYLYEWLDISDRKGEARAFQKIIVEAARVFQNVPEKHLELVTGAMNIDSSWDSSACRYLEMYICGVAMKNVRRRLVDIFCQENEAPMIAKLLSVSPVARSIF